MKYEVYYVIDEDTNEIIGTVTGTLSEATEKLEAMKDSREPKSEGYWHTWTLFRRAA